MVNNQILNQMTLDNSFLKFIANRVNRTNLCGSGVSMLQNQN